MKKKILLIATIAMMLLCLVACGKDKKVSVDGYYVFESSTHHDYAIEINGSSVTIYTNGNNYPSEQHGTVEHTETGADLYIVRESGFWEHDFNDYSPYHVKISEDGTLMYLSSDNSNWTTDTYRKVDKDEYDAVVGRCVGVKAQSEDEEVSNDVQATEGDVVVADDGMAMAESAPDEVAVTDETAEDESYRYNREDYIRSVFDSAFNVYLQICISGNNDFDAYVSGMEGLCWTDADKDYYEDNYKEYVSESEREILKEMTQNEEDMNYLFNISYDVTYDDAGNFVSYVDNCDDGYLRMDFDYIESKLQ